MSQLFFRSMMVPIGYFCGGVAAAVIYDKYTQPKNTEEKKQIENPFGNKDKLHANDSSRKEQTEQESGKESVNESPNKK